VRVVEAAQLDLLPRAHGYGPVVPAQVWAAVSQVQGRVVSMHPRLRNGEILAAGTELLRIDPTDYELMIAEVQADLAHLGVQEQNARASLEIEERNLVLAERDLERRRTLLKQNSVSQSVVDEAERIMLAARTAVQNLNNTLALIPAQRAQLEARAAQAQRDLEHTIFIAPFDLRVAGLDIEVDQFTTVGNTLFTGDWVGRVEIEAQFAITSVRPLLLGLETGDIDLAGVAEQLPQLLGFSPVVYLDLGDQTARWEAEFVRFGAQIDPETRTLGVVVAVDRPLEKVQPGRRPLLSKGMFVQVELRGQIQAARLVVPRSAVRRDVVHVADEDDRLRLRPVEVLFEQHGVSVIAQGLEPGEQVVISDPVPAVEGMLLSPQADEAAAQAMRSAAGAS
jgi:RND family efflux transporter MFP subunit